MRPASIPAALARVVVAALGWVGLGFFAPGCERAADDASPAAPAASRDPGATTPRSDASAPPPLPGFHFVERSREAGLDFRHTDGSSGGYYIAETLASGVALFDYDDDGDLDVYFPNGAPLPSSAEGASPGSRLYRNEGALRFTDVTAESGARVDGFAVGAAAGDYDGDGRLDLYVTCLGPNVLLRNRGDGTFTDVAAAAGVADARFSAASAFVDIDRDGDLDLYVSNYCEVPFEEIVPCENRGVPSYCAPSTYTPVHDALYRNEGDGTFVDVSESAGIARVARWGMGVLAADVDDDGLPDIYVANDVSDNFLFRNLGDGTFENVAMDWFAALSANGDEQGSMGLDAADLDGDGDFDFIVTNYQKQLNALYVREEGLGFAEEAVSRGLGSTCLPKVSWGTGLFDFDADGERDLFIANGHLEDRIAEFDESSEYRQRNQLFRGAGGRFTDITARAGPGLEEELSSRGAAFGDLDGDGDIDIVVSNSRDRASLLVAEGAPAHHWVAFDLRGRVNRFAIGARVEIEAGGVVRVAEVRSGGSYASQSGLQVHFGLGDATRVDRLEVRWPSGARQRRADLAVDRVHRVAEE